MNKLLLPLALASLVFSGCTILKDDSDSRLVFNPLAIFIPEDSIFSSDAEILSIESPEGPYRR